MKVLHIVNSDGPTNMGFNEFYKNRISYGDGYLKCEGFNFFKILRFILDYIKKSKQYELIHIHSHQLGFLISFLKKYCKLNSKLNIVYTVHTSKSNLTKLNYFFFRFIYKISSCVIFCSESSAKSFDKDFKSKNKSLYIRNGVNIYERNFQSEKADAVIVLGRLISIKRPIEILNSYLKSSCTKELIFIGDGPLKEEISNRFKYNEKFKKKVRFLGQIPRDRVLSNLCSSKYIVSYSTVEGLPISVLEAIDSGVIPVLSEIPAHQEIIKSGIFGMLVDDETELVDAFNIIENNKWEPNIIIKNKEILRKNFSINSMLKDYELVYRRFELARK